MSEENKDYVVAPIKQKKVKVQERKLAKKTKRTKRRYIMFSLSPVPKTGKQAFEDYWIDALNGDGQAGNWEESTFYWRYGNSLFIFLNTEEDGDEGNITGAQFDWFNETALNSGGYYKFVIAHRPLVGSNRTGTEGTLFGIDP